MGCLLLGMAVCAAAGADTAPAMLGESAIESLARWASPRPDLGAGVYQLTRGERDHRHAYHTLCPWSPDQRLLLLLRHDRENPQAKVCVLDTATGAVRVVGVTTRWNSHNAARQQWQGGTGRLVYTDRNEDGTVLVSVLPDGSGVRRFKAQSLAVGMCAPDGRHLYGTTPETELFGRDNGLLPRHDKGILRMDLEAGEIELVFSLEQALALHPDWERIAGYHLHPKAVALHPELPRLMFNLVNTPWDMSGRETRVRGIFSIGLDGSDPAYLGQIVHHPNWDPVRDRVVANVHDMNGALRFGLYRGDGSTLLEYVPHTAGSGHPTISRCGNWICTDGRRFAGQQTGIILCHITTGREIVAVRTANVSQGYGRGVFADMTADESVMDLRARRAADPQRPRRWQTHLHPVWSRDGTAIVFNIDEQGAGSQLFVLDVAAALRAAGVDSVQFPR